MEISEDVKLCKDCKHSTEFYLCVNPKHGIDYIDGSLNAKSCTRTRAFESLCGKEAKWFEEKLTEVQKQSVVKKVIKFFKKENK